MKKFISLSLLLAAALYSCDDPYEGSTYQVYDIHPASAYLGTRDDAAEWLKILDYADLKNAVNQATELFTLFVPDNEAVLDFYQRKGVSSIEELGEEYARDLAKFHILNDSVNYETFIAGGKLEKKTLSDDFLSVSFGEDGGANALYLNNEAWVYELATTVSNGYVYFMNAVLSPLVESAYEKLEERNDITLFREVLETTTWSDSLNTIYDEIDLGYGVVRQQKRNYTVLPVADDAYQKAGITSISQLANLLVEQSDEVVTPSEALFRYAAYHILPGNYSLFELQTFQGNNKKKLVDTSAGTILEFTEEADKRFYINYAAMEELGPNAAAQFVESKSNIAAKNGMIHYVDGYLPMWESTIPAEVIFDFCDFPEVASYIGAYGSEGQTYQKGGTSSELKTNIQSVSCYTVVTMPTATPLPTSPTSGGYYRVHYQTEKTGSAWMKNNLYEDQMILNLGYTGSISMRTPAIIKGKYKVTLYVCYATSMEFIKDQTNKGTGKDGTKSNGGMIGFTFDGEHAKDAPILSPLSAGMSGKGTLGTYPVVIYDELEFEKTGSKVLRMLIKDPAAETQNNFRLGIDRMVFEPIVE